MKSVKLELEQEVRDLRQCLTEVSVGIWQL